MDSRKISLNSIFKLKIFLLQETNLNGIAKDRETNRQTNRQTDRQTDGDRDTEIELELENFNTQG